MDNAWIPDSCTLPTVERPVRSGELDSLLATAVRGATRVHDGLLRLELDRSPDVAGQAARFAAKETSCCAFFTFTLTADGNGLRFEIAVPESQTPILDALAERVGT